jgi:hypothetical protein
VDLVSYVEYQRNHRLVLKTHKDALYAMRHFWQCLLHSKVGGAGWVEPRGVRGV